VKQFSKARGEITAIARAVVAHVKANPLASDTQAGIAHWWLEPGTAVSEEALAEALRLLTRAGVLEELQAADGRTRYRRCASDRELEALLAGELRSTPEPH
jgi:hypothetical protein